MSERIEIFARDISQIKEFSKYGDIFICLEADETRHMYLYGRYDKEDVSKRIYTYEVVLGKKTKNPDGTIVYTYPSAELFGKYALGISEKETAYKAYRLGIDEYKFQKYGYRETEPLEEGIEE